MKFKLTKSKHREEASLNNKTQASSKNNVNSGKVYAIVFGIFALVIVTTTASFAFFTYSRVGNTTTTITSGDIEFTYKEGEDASLANAFPVSDSVGANDTSEEYKFTVNLKSTSASNKMNYNVYLLDNNKEENTNYFNNEQIKFSLLKNDVFVAGTSGSKGIKLSELPGFDEGKTIGEGLVLEEQEISSGVTDEYKLRIWISDEVNYSNTDTVTGQDEQTSNGKYNGYKYSLKVKVASGTQTSIVFNDVTVSGKTIQADVSDPNGLDAYAVTTSSTTPGNESSEWIEITNDTAKSNVKRTANDKITSKIITYTVENDGVYYLHVRNDIKQNAKKSVIVGKGSEQTISFDSNGGNAITTTKVISYNGIYGELPTPERNGYIFTGWYTSSSGGQAVTESSVYSNVSANKLYAGWEKGKYTVTINPNEGTFEESTGETKYILEYQEEKNIPNPTRVGYTFDKWTVTGSESEVTNNIFKMGYTDATLKANWKINSYTLIVNPDGGTWNNSTSSQNFTLDYKGTKDIPNPTKDGHTFTGWEVTGTNASLNSTTFTIGNGNATLKATWEVNDYKYITKHYQQNVTANGYTLIDADTKEDTGKFGSQVTPSVNTYTGFTSPSPKILTITSNELNNLVEYQYARNKYNLTINPNGGTYNGLTSNTTTEMYYGASKTIDNPTAKTGYSFTNWTVSSGKMTDKVFTIGSSAATLTANYEANKYVVTFDANGGNVSQATKEVTYDSTYGTLPTPTKENCEFEGWYTEIDGGIQVIDTTKVNITENQTLYAKWRVLSVTAVDKIISLAATNTNELRIDTHAATGQQTFATTEYRYYGSNPNNYVEFNNELWRIIGVFKVDDGTGNIEERLKIIRANPIGNYSWDSSASGVNNGYGVNEWNQADLMTLLNSGAYYNRITGTCYNNNNNTTTPCDFSAASTTPGLSTEAREMIGNAKWYLGAGVEVYTSFTAADFYNNERGTNIGKQCSSGTYCNDTVTRKTYWTGEIGLMYPSDYGYSANMTSCSSTALYAYNKSCKDSSWLINSTYNQWTLSPRPYSSRAHYVFYVNSTGHLSNSDAYYAHGVRPVTYLKSDIQIIDGVGTDQQPFKLSK